MKLEKLSRWTVPWKTYFIPRLSKSYSWDSSRDRHLYDAVDRYNVWGSNIGHMQPNCKGDPGQCAAKSTGYYGEGDE